MNRSPGPVHPACHLRRRRRCVCPALCRAGLRIAGPGVEFGRGCCGERGRARLCRGDYGPITYGHPSASAARAADVSGGNDEDLLRRYLCIHHPHKVSAAARASLAHPRVVRGLTAVIGPNVKAMQSMLFIKSEGKPGQAWHQDEFFIPTWDRSLTAVRIAPTTRRWKTAVSGCFPASSAGDPVSDARAERPAVRLHDRGLRLPLCRCRRGAGGDSRGHCVVLQWYLLHRSLRTSAGTATVERWPTTT